MGTFLFEKGDADFSVAMRTGHRNPMSLNHYQHLMGREGKSKQIGTLGDGTPLERNIQLSSHSHGHEIQDVAPEIRVHDPEDGTEAKRLRNGHNGADLVLSHV